MAKMEACADATGRGPTGTGTDTTRATRAEVSSGAWPATPAAAGCLDEDEGTTLPSWTLRVSAGFPRGELDVTLEGEYPSRLLQRFGDEVVGHRYRCPGERVRADGHVQLWPVLLAAPGAPAADGVEHRPRGAGGDVLTRGHLVLLGHREHRVASPVDELENQGPPGGHEHLQRVVRLQRGLPE